MMAVTEDHIEAVEVLVRGGADVDLLTKTRKSAKDMAKSLKVKALLESSGNIDSIQGPKRIELMLEQMESQMTVFKDEIARYELTENQNEKLSQEVENMKLERDSYAKTLEVGNMIQTLAHFQTVCAERDSIQTELERLRKELTKTTQQLEGKQLIKLLVNRRIVAENRERAEIEELLAKERNDFETDKQELSDRILRLEGSGKN